MNAHKALLANVQPGDEIMTTAGLYGTVVELSDDNMYLQVAPGVELRFARGAIARVVSSGEGGLDDDFDDDDDVDAEPDELDEPTDLTPDDGRENPAR
jgi:preprotein translocase subunit YajC